MATRIFRRPSCFGVSLLAVAVASLASLAVPARAQAQTKSLYQLQSEHIDLRFGMFIHFNMNTYFPGWGEARTDPKTFNPTNLNTNQWATAAKSAKMTYALLTTKHHDGFAIWPSKQTPPNGKTPYTIAQSSTPTRDVVKDYVDSFRAQGILPGLYFSMWDTANVGGTYDAPGYSDNGTVSWSKVKTFILGQITELLGGTYGEIPIFVIDGWSWSMGHRYAPYQEIRAHIKKLQPNCLIVDHNGALPWEVDIMYFEEPLKIQAPAGNTIAACQGQTISGDWFWDTTAASSGSLMTAADIVSHINRLQPLYTNFILNCPPNRQGVFDQAIVDRLGQVGTMWSVANRAALPTQPPAIEYPITGVTATATSGSSPMNAIDSANDYTDGPRHQTLWQSSGALPQSVTVDLGAVYNGIDILRYVPNRDTATGAITSYRVLGSADGTTFTQVASGTWAASSGIKTAQFTATSARYMRLEAVAVNGGSSAVVGEVAVGGNATPVSTGALGTGGSGAGGAAAGGRGGGAGGGVATGGAGGGAGTGGGAATGGTGTTATGGSGAGGTGGNGSGGTGGGSGGNNSATGGSVGQSGGATASGGSGSGSGGNAASGGSGSATDGGAKAGSGGGQTGGGSSGCGCRVASGVAGTWASFALTALALAGVAGGRTSRRRRRP